jgi:LPS export ABC transporter permease LptG/LPS export ABC transporter permease LptF
MLWREAAVSASLGLLLFTFVLFLRGAGQLFEILVRNAATPGEVGYLFLLVLPQVMPFTIPLGVLVGILIALGRMSSDGEITAMRAAGVPGRRLVLPILSLSALALIAAAACALWLAPWSIRERYRVLNQIIANQLTAEVEPRVFQEEFPNKVLYVGDVIPSGTGPVVRWRNVFVADLTPPTQKMEAGHERGESPRVTLAREAIATPDAARNRIQLTLFDGSTHDVGKEIANYSISAFPKGDQILEAKRRGEVRSTRPSIELDTPPLYRVAYKEKDVDETRLRESRIEFHQRFALPMACILLALVGIPLGMTARKAGRSSAIVLTVALAFLYYMGMISLINLARQGKFSVPIAVWTPNVIFAIAGVVLMLRLEKPGDFDIVGHVRAWLQSLWPKKNKEIAAVGFQSHRRLPIWPGVIDSYILSVFLFYFAVLLVSFVLMTHVFTFFELLSDIVRNGIAMPLVGAYHLFLTPKLLYDFTPFSILVAVLILFGVLTKHNEVTAFKACGVSLYRLAAPVLIASMVLSGALFAFDHYYVPEANRRQDALRAIIKGRPVQTFLRPDRKWIRGQGNRVFYYKYFSTEENVMGNVSVYEFHPQRFELSRHIEAEKARWEPSLKKWVFQNGWVRDLDGIRETAFQPFTGSTMTFPEINEAPEYFVKEVKQSKQMNFLELKSYITELQQSGFETTPLQVQYHKKFALPLFGLIMALVSVPFAFMAGNRGAMTGVGLSFAITIAYWVVNQVFEQVGNLGQLPPEVAAWAPDALFAMVGSWFLLRLRS